MDVLQVRRHPLVVLAVLAGPLRTDLPHAELLRKD